MFIVFFRNIIIFRFWCICIFHIFLWFRTTGRLHPTTLKLLHTYNDVQGQQGENAETIRRDIAGILHTLNQAYSNLYDNLLSDVAMDVSSEIAALQGMLANDGLTGEGLL